MAGLGGILVRCMIAVGISAGSTATTQAAPIAEGSTLNFAGQSSCNATTCTFGNAIVTSGTGSFSSFTFGTTATFFTVSYDPFTPQQIYTTTNALAQTASFFTTSQIDVSARTIAGLTNYLMTDAGIASLTGFDDTAGTYLFTANQNGTVQGSFSATTVAAAVPEPATWAMMILGSGVIGLALRRRRPTPRRVSPAA